MSRIGKKPVTVPAKVNVALADHAVNIEGPQGKLHWEYPGVIDVAYDEAARLIKVTRQRDDRQGRALHGLTRAMIQNMVVGASTGYEKKLEIVGVGYLAAIAGTTLQLRVGFANEVHLKIPAGLKVACPDQTHISIKGPDKQMVGQFAAEVRGVREPEPYKGKGIRYEGEHVRRKAGKAVGT